MAQAVRKGIGNEPATIPAEQAPKQDATPKVALAAGAFLKTKEWVLHPWLTVLPTGQGGLDVASLVYHCSLFGIKAI